MSFNSRNKNDCPLQNTPNGFGDPGLKKTVTRSKLRSVFRTKKSGPIVVSPCVKEAWEYQDDNDRYCD